MSDEYSGNVDLSDYFNLVGPASVELRGPLTAVSLFAGVGGFDLAMERCGIDVVTSVEIDKSARSVLSSDGSPTPSDSPTSRRSRAMSFETQASFPIVESSPEGSLAKTYQSLDVAPDWLVDALASSGRSFGLLTSSALGGSSSRTYLVSCRVTTDETLVPCSGPWLSAGTGSLTGFLTLNTSEFHSDAVESSLSDVLETTGEHLLKYSLSPKACVGILRRAQRRGRTLPTALQLALEAVAQTITQRNLDT